jgi:hypothetical protein
MFDSGYKFALVSKTTVSKKLFLRQHINNFRSLFRRYLAVVEEYELNVFIVKFFPVSHKLSDKKYNVIFNDYDAPRVIRTCIDIMLSIATENELASFGFIGANTISEDFYVTHNAFVFIDVSCLISFEKILFLTSKNLQ